jgi:hypothetical protein
MSSLVTTLDIIKFYNQNKNQSGNKLNSTTDRAVVMKQWRIQKVEIPPHVKELLLKECRFYTYLYYNEPYSMDILLDYLNQKRINFPENNTDRHACVLKLKHSSPTSYAQIKEYFHINEQEFESIDATWEPFIEPMPKDDSHYLKQRLFQHTNWERLFRNSKIITLQELYVRFGNHQHQDLVNIACSNYLLPHWKQNIFQESSFWTYVLQSNITNDRLTFHLQTFNTEVDYATFTRHQLISQFKQSGIDIAVLEIPTFNEYDLVKINRSVNVTDIINAYPKIRYRYRSKVELIKSIQQQNLAIDKNLLPHPFYEELDNPLVQRTSTRNQNVNINYVIEDDSDIESVSSDSSLYFIALTI